MLISGVKFEILVLTRNLVKKWAKSMYGKIFESMFQGSMIGAGSHVFAVWAYVIANMRPDREVGAQVDLNPKLLGFILGEEEERVRGAIEYLCRPDGESRTPDEQGRRLVQMGEYAYRVVNGAKYRAIRDEETRRRQNREAKRRERERKRGHPLPGERAYVEALKRGDGDGDSIVEANLPQSAGRES